MAVIHQAPNPARQELQKHLRSRMDFLRRAHESSVQNRPRTVCISAIALALCVAAVLALLLCPGLLKTAQTAVKDLLMDWSDWLLSYVPPGQYDDPFLERVIEGLLGVLLMILLAIIGAVVYLIGCVAPLVVAVVLYGVPIAAGIYFGDRLIHAPGEFNPEWAKDHIMSTLTADQQITLAGIEGEDRALHLMASLDDRCHVFTNVRIPWEGKVSETDMIVVTPSGVTIVEVKNHKNRILGDLSDHDLFQQHVGSRGRVTEKKFYNPVKQVGTHVYRLANYLRSRGAGTHVSSCVLFINDQVELQLRDRSGLMATCPVFRANDPALLRRLNASGTVLTQRQIASIVSALEYLVQNPPL